MLFKSYVHGTIGVVYNESFEVSRHEDFRVLFSYELEDAEGLCSQSDSAYAEMIQ